MRTHKSIVLFFCFLLILFSFSSISMAQTRELPDDAAPASEQVLQAPLFGEDGTYMDPMKTVYNRVGDEKITREPLTRFDKELNVIPGGAKSWEVSDDKLTWTFHLFEDLKWSDGEPLTANDFLFALTRALKQGYDFSWYYSWAANIKNWGKVESGELPHSELGVKVVDDVTIKVTTNDPLPYLPGVLRWWFPVPEHQVEKYGDEYATKAETLVTNGPFMVQEWVKDQRVVCVPNPYWHGPKPYLHKIILKYGTRNPETGFPAYQTGELDWSSLNPGQIALVKKQIPEQLYTWPENHILYLTMNTNVEPFNNEKVRKAIGYAINREKLTNTILEGLAKKLTTLLAPGFPGHKPSLTDTLSYDVEKAQRLLKEAGYPDGEGFPTITLYVRNQQTLMAVQKPLSQYVQNQLSVNLGINVEIRLVETKVWTSYLNNREQNFFLSPYNNDYFDPSNFMNLFTTGGREPWSNEKYDELVNKANSSFDSEERSELYKKAEKIFLEKVPAVPLVHNNIIRVIRPYLKGEALEPNSSGQVRFGHPGPITTYSYIHVYIGEGK